MRIIRKESPIKKVKGTSSVPASRLNLLLRSDLKDWAHSYAETRGKSLSSLITDYLYDLREQKRDSDVEQI
jgi:hypothetical protein